MRKGKMIAQGAHASMKIFFDKFQKIDGIQFPSPIKYGINLFFAPSEEELAWIDGLFTKICVGVDSEEDLLGVYTKAKMAGLNCSLIKDAGLTEFSEPTYTAVAIGPNKVEDIDPLTRKLNLL